ncbi:MAG: ATP-binding protein, partial [Myxococcota bacterium]
GWMESAVGNLLANAMRFAKSRVSVSAVDLGGDICIEVADDGPGIPPDEAARIFERFSQAGTDESRRKGTGLGLAIVREAARLHGGTVDVGESEHGGALFMVRIPRLLADGPASAFQAGAPAIEADRNAAMDDVPGPHPAAPVALVAEDHPELRGFIGEVLATQFRVLVTDRGDTALERAVREQPDVIVADISMPGMDGLELCRALRQTEEARDTPILLVTARGEPQQVLQGFDAGANDYLVKPFHGRELLARIDAQLRLRSMVHRLAHQERLASLGVLAASVAHQVRNPLTALVSGLPAVKRKIGGTLDDRTKEMMDVFVDCAHRIERITLDLLDLSRVDREEEGDLNPGAGLMAAVRLTTAQLPDDVEIHTEVDETTQIRGRAGDLNHVFLNLLDNAARAVGRRGRVSIHGLREDGIYRVTVEDSGNGVPEDIADRIFEPFVTSRPGGEGTGLGLAIVHDIVVAHRGEISVDRSPSLGGARFTITLPVSGEESVAAE